MPRLFCTRPISNSCLKIFKLNERKLVFVLVIGFTIDTHMLKTFKTFEQILTGYAVSKLHRPRFAQELKFGENLSLIIFYTTQTLTGWKWRPGGSGQRALRRRGTVAS